MPKIMIGSSLIGMLLVSGMAQGVYNGPYLVKEADSMDTLRQVSKSQKCEIFAGKTVLATSFGGLGKLATTETKNQTFEGEHPALLEKAANTPLDRGTPSTELGTTVRYYGFLVKSDDSVTKVLLYEENAETGHIISNPSQEARLLRIVIEHLCPNTIQSSAN